MLGPPEHAPREPAAGDPRGAREWQSPRGDQAVAREAQREPRRSEADPGSLSRSLAGPGHRPAHRSPADRSPADRRERAERGAGDDPFARRTLAGRSAARANAVGLRD